MRRIAFALFGGILYVILACYVYKAYADSTVIQYQGQPVPSAIAPGMSSFSQDVCAVPVSGAISSTVIGFSGGSMYTDSNCERIKLAKTLNDLGLKVAAVAVLAQDSRVWDAMMMSGTPPPIDGLIGDALPKLSALIKGSNDLESISKSSI